MLFKIWANGDKSIMVAALENVRDVGEPMTSLCSVCAVVDSSGCSFKALHKMGKSWFETFFHISGPGSHVLSYDDRRSVESKMSGIPVDVGHVVTI